jgi:hypothetical protein
MLAFSSKMVHATDYLLQNFAVCNYDGEELRNNIYLSMFTWQVKELTLEVALTRSWFKRLCHRSLKNTKTLKSNCRNFIISIIETFDDVEVFNIPDVLKNYLIYGEELKILKIYLRKTLASSQKVALQILNPHRKEYINIENILRIYEYKRIY